MLQKYLDFIGKQHGRLTILAISKKPQSRAKFHCICTCGNYKSIDIYNTKYTKSCGCAKIDYIKTIKTHGQSGRNGARTKAYRSWLSMRRRCYETSSASYKNYGGRGIKVAQEWQSFINFYNDMGDPPDGTTIDRIDVNGNYEKSNCRWATKSEQAKNKRNNLILNIDGERLHLMEAARRYKCNFQTIWARIKTQGWTDRQAIGLDPKPPKRTKATQ